MNRPTNGVGAECAADNGDRPLVLALSDDLMLVVRIEAAARAAELAFASVDSRAQAIKAVHRQAPAAIVLDLTSPAFPVGETLGELRQAGVTAPVIAFYPHVMKALGRTARELGCTIVVPRSRFLTDTVALLRAAVEGHADTVEPEPGEEAPEPATGSSARE